MALCRRRKFNLVTKNCTKNKYKKKHHKWQKNHVNFNARGSLLQTRNLQYFFSEFTVCDLQLIQLCSTHMKTDSLESLNVENYANFLGSPAAQAWKTCHIPPWPLKLLNASLLQAASLNPLRRLPNLRPPFENAPRPRKNERTSH